MHDLRDLSPTATGRGAYVTGATAVSVDVATALNDALPIYLVLVVGLALVLLVLVFRSILVPLVGVLGFLLTDRRRARRDGRGVPVGLAGGLVNLDSTGPLISLTPIIVIGILFGLAMDYQVFLVSRMHEAHAHGPAPWSRSAPGSGRRRRWWSRPRAIMFSVFAGFVPAGDGDDQVDRVRAGHRHPVRRLRGPDDRWCRPRWRCSGERAWWLPTLAGAGCPRSTSRVPGWSERRSR